MPWKLERLPARELRGEKRQLRVDLVAFLGQTVDQALHLLRRERFVPPPQGGLHILTGHIMVITGGQHER
jgi:hypothetical protein